MNKMAHKNNANKQVMPTHIISAANAPPPYDAYVHRAPPPSYEESQQRCQGPQGAYGYTNPYQVHMQQQHMYYQQAPPPTMQAAPSTATPHVLTFAKGAVVRTTANGSVTVPPPPPGCAPTPAQLAAMQGQQVIIKKQKNSFF